LGEIIEFHSPWNLAGLILIAAISSSVTREATGGTMENTTGWKVVIRVPQLNGEDDQHIWVAAISDVSEVRKRLWLEQIPCEAQLEPLSAEEFGGLRLERGEVRRILRSWTATLVVKTAVDEVVHPAPKPEVPEPKLEEHISLPMEPDDPSWDQSEEAALEGPSGDEWVEIIISPPTEPGEAGMGSKPQEAAEEGSWSDEDRDHEVSDTPSEPARPDRLWRRLWRARQRSDHG
jgi:hypothetical protein